MFKVGDKIKCLPRREGTSLKTGLVYEVLDVLANGNWISIFINGEDVDVNSGVYGFDPKRFKLVSSKQKENHPLTSIFK
jgi:hypothetical protein